MIAGLQRCAVLALLALVLPGAAHADGSDLRALQSSPAQATGAAAGRDRLDADRAVQASQAAIGRSVGDYSLTASDGRPIRLSSLRGKPLLVSFVYTGCFQVCPTTTRTLLRSVESAVGALGPDSFNVVSVGFNQPFDTPQAMAAFARQQGVYLPNWHFLSGDAGTVQALAADLGFSFAPYAGGFDHITQVTVLDAGGRVYRQVYGDTFPLPQLVGPLKELITGRPAEAGSVSALLERVRLLCTYYDASSGRYRFKYAILLEIVGGVTGVFAAAGFLLMEARKVRRARRAPLNAG